jgi:hypothetical protein
MAETVEQSPSGAYTETDLIAAVRQVLERSEEPLTLSKIRAALPAALRGISLEALEEALQRQVGANVLHQYPRYRSQQRRYWDRPMRVHLTFLLRTTLEERPLTFSELQRKLPDYARLPREEAERVLQEEVDQGVLFRHPALSSRSGARFGARRPDPKEYLRSELAQAFARLEGLGFSVADLREGALELLHEEEWAPSQQRRADRAGEEQPASGSSGAPQEHARTGDTPRTEAQQPLNPEEGPSHNQGHQPQAAAPVGLFGEGNPS